VLDRGLALFLLRRRGLRDSGQLLAAAKLVFEPGNGERGDIEVCDRADLRGREIGEGRIGGKAGGGGFNRGALGGGRRGVDAPAEHDEVDQRSASPWRQRERVHVGLEVSLVTRVGKRRVEGVV